MRQAVGPLGWLTLLGLVLSGLPGPAAAELADVYLKNGLRLRGDVTRSGDEVIVRNAAGETRLPADAIEAIVPVAAAPPPATAPTGPPATAPGAEPAEPEEAAIRPEPGHVELPPAPPISARDINRLRLGELTRIGPPETVKVRFLRKAGQKDVVAEVLDELRARDDWNAAWELILTRGRPEERVQFIVRETGLKYAERIAVESDPEAFALFRRRPLQIVHAGCARAGCHGGRAARVFRFPLGGVESEKYAYTTFVLLDEMQTKRGPLINRANPEQSVLLSYLLPQENNPRAHPPVGRGPTFRPMFRDTEDPAYRSMLEWLDFLLDPRPDYGLAYENPYRGPFGVATQPAETAAASGPAATQPGQPVGPPTPAAAPGAP